MALVLAVAGTASAQGTPGFVSLTLAGVGGQTTVSGESRLPVRPRDGTLEAGVLHVRAMGSRGSVREVTFAVPGAAAGQRAEVGGDTTLEVVFASGNAMSPAAGHGWVTVDELDADHAAGTLEATLTEGRLPLTLRGRFEVHFTH